MSGTPRLVSLLIYGSGLRLLEALRLRVKDIDFASNQLTVREGKGQKDRITMLPSSVKSGLLEHLRGVRQLHGEDLSRGLGQVFLSEALSRKYPNAAGEWGWQYVFPATEISIDPRSGERRRHHLDESVIQKAVKRISRQVGLNRTVTPHTFRSLLGDAPSGRRLRYSQCARVVRSPGGTDHHDLYSHVESRRPRGAEPGRPNYEIRVSNCVAMRLGWDRLIPE